MKLAAQRHCLRCPVSVCQPQRQKLHQGRRNLQLITFSASSSANIDDLSSRLQQSEDEGDWATTLEIVTEAKVLKIELPAATLESAVRTYARSGQQWARAADLFEVIIKRGETCSAPTVEAMFQALAQGRQGTRAQLLLKTMQLKANGSFGSLSPLYNLTVRALVKQGESDAAVSLLEEMVKSEGEIQIEGGTFTMVAGELLRSGKEAQAEEVLEMRDYM